MKSLLEIVRYRGLLWNLTLRDIRIRYKQALLGAGWAVFQPLCLMLLFSFVFSKVTRVDTGEIPYPIFAYAGLVPWQFFQQGILTATVSLVQNNALVTKIYVPRQVFSFAAILSKLVDFVIAFAVLLLLMLYFDIPLRFTLLWVPFLLCVQLVFMTGLGLLVSMGNLFYRDVGYVMNTLMMIWMFATPVVYPLRGTTGFWRVIFQLNPMTPIIEAYRDVLLVGINPDWAQLALSLLMSMVLFAVAWCWFQRLQHLFAERI
jgi:lipopolysaccharide transport system permease protein